MRRVVLLAGCLLYSWSLIAQSEQQTISIDNIVLDHKAYISSTSTDDRKYMDVAFDTDRNSFYLLINRALYVIEPLNGVVTLADSLVVPDDVTMVEYSPYHSSLIIWDRGVGRVFLRDPEGQLIRIDNSFQHRNQFNHSPWIDPKDGKIYAFGGYGLFTHKSIITRFSPSTKEWELLPSLNDFHGPVAQSHAQVYTDFSRRQIYLRGNSAKLSDNRADLERNQALNAIWKFSLENRSWKRIAVLDEIAVVDLSPLVPNSLTNNSVDPNHPLLLFHNRDLIHQYDLIAVDTETGNFRNLSELNPGLKLTLPILGIFWSDVDQAYYVLSYRIMSNQNQMHIDLKRIKVHDYDELMSWINYSDNGSDVWSYMLILMVLLIPGVWVGRRWLNTTDVNAKPVKLEPISGIQVQYGSNGQLILHSEVAKTDEIPTMESKLLETLLAQLPQAGVFVKSDDIDHILLPDHPSPDYIRRNRNLTLERLETLLQSLYELPGETYILRRTNRNDKRKNEYRLNEKYIRG